MTNLATKTPEAFGAEAFNATDDGSYTGASYTEIIEAAFANPYQPVWNGAGHLPRYDVTLGSVVSGLYPFSSGYKFKQAATRTLASHADLRWGQDNQGFRRIVHPNGIILNGEWAIHEETEYSGYFKKDSRGLVIARYSTCCTNTKRDTSRSLAMVGKVFPTLDPASTEKVIPANFITQEDLGGGKLTYINDAILRNAPDTTLTRRPGLSGPVILAITGILFQLVNKTPTQRQLYEIAELGKGADEPTRTPEFMQLTVSPDQPRIDGDGIDFRDEIYAQIYDAGDPTPKRELVFDINVTDEGKSRGLMGFEYLTFKNWKKIGTLTFKEAVSSYNGDYVVHFHHPAWRDDRNNPTTLTPIAGHTNKN
ncbi:MAG: hypothetical protein AAF639_21485 [Chloroflexota bacterium]